MSSQRFSNEERYAIWTAHGHKCYWQGELLTVNAMVIDHVVPESIGNLPEAERRLELAKLFLDADYDVREYYNLVPSCMACNGKKSARLLSPVSIGFTLAITRPLADKIRSSVEEHVTGRTLGIVMHYVNSSLEKNAFSSAQLLTELKNAGIEPAPFADIIEMLKAVSMGDVQGRRIVSGDGSSTYRLRWRGFTVVYEEEGGELLVHSLDHT